MLKLQARTTVTSQFVRGHTFPVDTPSLRVSEIPLHGIIRIQGGSESAQTRAIIESVLALNLPLPERSTQDKSKRLAWVGPNEWLVLCAVEEELGILNELTKALADQFSTVTLVSDSRVSFLVAGDVAADFVAKGCAIDLHATAFPVGATVTTRFAGLPAMLLHRDTCEYVLYFDVSMAGFLIDWLSDASEEFDV
ncbi:sarcosine oxidase subunit gamma family protein [Paraburkholderia agricolaris]|uniref:sarcosine oxidase subunit gamma n=1 Tax=Paraburkholderia agricolaris TaxID=2152888 RepID=UPI0038BAF261